MHILIVSHDAGGAVILSSWINANNTHIFDLLLEGPAREIFKESIQLNGVNIIQSEEDIQWMEYDLVLASTSWGSDLEKRYIVLAKEKNIKSASYLDHWVNYKARFELHGKLVLPDEIWVGDFFAQKLAEEVFFQDQVSIKFVENQYMKSINPTAFNNPEQSKSSQCVRRILYICEPMAGHVSCEQFGFDEFILLERFLTILTGQNSMGNIEIIIRTHPSEKRDKYQPILFPFTDKLNVSISDKSLLQDCFWADEVVGISSMAMMVADQAGRKVFKLPEMEGASCYTLPVNFPNFQF